MIDRAIGIVGIAFTIITAFLQYYWPKLPSWGATAGFGIGSFLLGLSIGLVAAGGFRRRPRTVQRAFLRLHIFGDHRTPDRLAAENIFRWFYLQTLIKQVGPDGVVRNSMLSTLYVSFDSDVIISTINVRSPDMQLPVYEIKEFNQRFAIIAFMGNVPAGTLEVAVTP